MEDVLVNTSLFLIALAGISFLALPEAFFGIPKNGFSGELRYWGSTLKLFAIPLSLLLLNFSKNVVIQLVISVWGLWLFGVSVLLLLKVEEHAPAITLYGRSFIAGCLIFSLCMFIFSVTKLLPKDLKFSRTDDPPVNPS